MKKIFASIIAILALGAAAQAIPAWRGFISHTQPDGSTIMIRIHGDEFFHWTTDASGQPVEMDADGYFRPVSQETVELRRNASKARRTAIERVRKSGTHIALGEKRFLVILVEFSDETSSFASSTANADFTAMLNEPGYNINGGTGSARDFYYDNSHGLFTPVFDVYGPVKLAKTSAYYAGSDGTEKAYEAVKQGCQALNEQIDFSQYDNDGDGTVDLVFMYYAGYGAADTGRSGIIWPHQWSLSAEGASITLDGKKIDSYACSNEIEGQGTYVNKMCGIGTACHEFGHAMGLPDFYDTDYATNGQSAAMFDFSIMDSGGYNNDGRTPPYFTIEERIMLGWIGEDSFLDFTKSGHITLPSVNENVAYRTMTDTEGEYFVYEFRGTGGWDAGLTAHGLIITHVDKSTRQVNIKNGYGSTVKTTAKELWENWEAYNSINENGSHPCCYIIPANDQDNLIFAHTYDSQDQYYYPNYNKFNQIPFPYKSVTSYTAKSWNNVESEISLSNITYSGGTLSFDVTVPTVELDYNVIANPGSGTYAAGSEFSLELVEASARPVVSVAWYFDDEPVSGPTVTLKAGTHTIEAVITLTSGDTQTVTLDVTAI